MPIFFIYLILMDDIRLDSVGGLYKMRYGSAGPVGAALAAGVGGSGDRGAGDLGDLGDSATAGDEVDDLRNTDGEGEWAE